jgi:hypothetical protein
VGALREWTGTYAWGFILLSAASIGCLMLVMRRTQVQPRFA